MVPPTVAVALPAHAYGTETVVTTACHEPMLMRAMREVRRDLPAAGPLPADSNEMALINDVPFGLDADMKDLAAVSVILGNRHNDIKGYAPHDVDKITQVQANPGLQMEHCLRGPDHDEPTGSSDALDDCRAYIRQHALLALDGLDGEGRPDPAKRTTLEVHLDLRGGVDAALPTYHVHMGHALHALQDSFSHSFRTADGLRITTVLNYIDQVEDRLDEARDGPAHISELDRCDDPDDLRRLRRILAEQATVDMLRATLDPALTPEGKMEAVDAVLNRYVSYEPGCTFDNNWCDAPERAYSEPGRCSCSAAGAAGSRGMAGAATALVVGLAWAVRKRRQRIAPALGAAVLAALCLVPTRAIAQDDVAPPTATQPNAPSSAPDANNEGVAITSAAPTVAAPDGSLVATDTTPDAEERPPFPLGVYVAAGGSIQKSALNFSLGLRYRVSQYLLVGLDGEWNPWISRAEPELEPGVINGYATVIARYPLRFQRVNLRTTVHGGVTRMMFDLYGVPEGNIGPYFGFNLLGLDIELARSWYLVVDPADIALPAPQTDGAPFIYWQYRFTVGLQFGA